MKMGAKKEDEMAVAVTGRRRRLHGKLSDARGIVVKRLSQRSGQGKKEFLNKAKLLARVQHRNVVNLLGYYLHMRKSCLFMNTLLMRGSRTFHDEADDVIEVQTPLLFQLVHSKNFNVGFQALMILDKTSSKNQIVSDPFYRALYANLLFPAAMNSSKEEMFIALILRAVKNDINIKRLAAFCKH